jgi:hypothetical protein
LTASPPAPDSSGTQKVSDETLRAEYHEVCSSHEAITGFRGKLLGLLPIATGAGIFLLLDRSIKQQQTAVFLVAAGIFGAAVTIGLYFYEFRGMNECHLLRQRGANLERELQIILECSRFQGNPPGRIGPREAGPVVYFAVVAGWIFVSVYRFILSSLTLEIVTGGIVVAAYLLSVFVSIIVSQRRHSCVQDALTQVGL